MTLPQVSAECWPVIVWIVQNSAQLFELSYRLQQLVPHQKYNLSYPLYLLQFLPVYFPLHPSMALSCGWVGCEHPQARYIHIAVLSQQVWFRSLLQYCHLRLPVKPSKVIPHQCCTLYSSWASLY